MISFVQADARHIPLPNESVQCAITSPPYYGLRKYDAPDINYGKWSGQLGLEPAPEMYLAHLVEIFREVRRVLRQDGVLWLNMGESYAGSGNYRGVNSLSTLTAKQRSNRGSRGLHQELGGYTGGDYKAKDMMLLPHQLALALRHDGWWIRSTVVWEKPNCMPESVRDRPTLSHEYVFLFAKSRKYFFNRHAIQVPTRPGNKTRKMRNRRTVWSIPNEVYAGAHYATFPQDLVEIAVKSTSRSGYDIVLDPFGGTGTAAIVADRLGRHGIVMDISNNYLHLAQERYQKDLEKR